MKNQFEPDLYDYCEDIDLDEFREMVAVSAYFRAEKRDFNPGQELDDWLEAEHEIRKQRRYWLK
ncbi:MAG: DUF2934 domain-containing protein [Methylococcaceae bacterium]|nr:DUF2934 domain-containing protein [Methylococcaceae bacterium]